MRGAGQFQQRSLGAQLSQELLAYFLKESDTAEMGGQVQKADSTNHQSTEKQQAVNTSNSTPFPPHYATSDNHSPLQTSGPSSGK